MHDERSSTDHGSVHANMFFFRWDAYQIEKTQGGRGVAGGSSRTFARPIPLAVADAYDVRVDGECDSRLVPFVSDGMTLLTSRIAGALQVFRSRTRPSGT